MVARSTEIDVQNGHEHTSTVHQRLMGPILLLIATALMAYYGFTTTCPRPYTFRHHHDDCRLWRPCADNRQSKLALVFMMPPPQLLNTVASEAKLRSGCNPKREISSRDRRVATPGNQDPDRQLNKADFIMATLKAYDLVDEETLQVIADGFKEVAGDEGDSKDPLAVLMVAPGSNTRSRRYSWLQAGLQADGRLKRIQHVSKAQTNRSATS